MIETISGATLASMYRSAFAAIENEKQNVNELNVFPVPDGDTGTNMALTFAPSADVLSDEGAPAGKVASLASNLFIRSARGNSGVILSLLFRGFAKSVKDLDEIDGAAFAKAMREGVDAAYKAVMKPAEGTMLTVARVSAERGVEAATENRTAEFVLREMLASAEEALAETIHQNPVLEKAGVIDAGGRGYVLILEGMLDALLGNERETAPREGESAAKKAADFSDFDISDIQFCYCTEFIVNRENEKNILKFRAFLDAMGDSLVFLDDEEIIKVHVHTNDPGKCLSEALKYGSLSKVKIDNMREQHTEKVIITGKAPVLPGERTPIAPEKQYGFVAVSSGEGLSDVLRDAGVDELVEGGQTTNPSTEDILRAIDRVPAEIVFVLPNNKNIILAAEQTVAMSDKMVVVVPSRSIPQGISALLAFDADEEPSKNRERMQKALGMVRTGQITYAARASTFEGRKIKEGDYLAILDGELNNTGKNLTSVVRKLARELAKKGAEFITVYYGENSSEEEAKGIGDLFQKEFSSAEVSVIEGGQPVYRYLISVE